VVLSKLNLTKFVEGTRCWVRKELQGSLLLLLLLLVVLD
jgi:hypothetical protein